MSMWKPGRGCKSRPKARRCNLCSDMRLNAISFGARMEASRSIDTIAVKQCHRRHLQFHCPLDKVLRLRRTLEKAKGACRVQLYIAIVSHRTLPCANRSLMGRAQGNSTESLRPEHGQQGPIARRSNESKSTSRCSPATDHRLVLQHNASHETGM